MSLQDLNFPADLHYDIEQQVWARPEVDGTVTVGITSLGIRLAGEIYMCRPKAPGTAVERGRAIAVVELAKSIVAVKSPISGQVELVNDLLSTRPELVHLDPYGQGWIARLIANQWVHEAAALAHGEAVLPAMQHHAWLHRES